MYASIDHFAVSFLAILCPWNFWFLSNLRRLLILDAEAGESKKVTVVSNSVGRVWSGSNTFSVLFSYLKLNPSKEKKVCLPECISAWLCIHWGPGNGFYWLEHQTFYTPLPPGIYGISFHWLLGKFWLQNMVHLEEVEWETCCMSCWNSLTLFSSPWSILWLCSYWLSFWVLQVFCCAQSTMCFWEQIIWHDRELLNWLCSLWAVSTGQSFVLVLGETRVDKWRGWYFVPVGPHEQHRSETLGLGRLLPVFLLVRAMCLGKDMAQLGCGTCTSPSALIIHHCRETEQ